MKNASYLVLVAFALLMITTASSCPEQTECKTCTYQTTDGQTFERQVCGEMEKADFLDGYQDFNPSCP
ncbi:MAG: hypothetical protein KTR30_25665 [Saprospiraceae bacterium]|nr:hypothetical protein [Saprospiraceae bacterium]